MERADDTRRADHDLAFLLTWENIAWYDDAGAGCVRILDRRKYPSTIEFVTCADYAQVAQAIADMVTQSGGPYVAAEMGMALAARRAEKLGDSEFAAYMEKAAHALSHARPTTVEKMAGITAASLKAAIEARAAGRRPDLAIFERALATLDTRYRKSDLTARYLVDMFPDGGTVMTQCFGETIVGTMLRECRRRNRDIRVICPETRPYLQGARLTASVVHDMGFDVTVITDNMPGLIMKERKVDVFTSAADVICLDGTVINKVGTFQIALAARYWGIPYFVTGTPDRRHATAESVTIEYRDPDEVVSAMGIRTAMRGVKGLYPAFDITPAKLCDGVVTDKGIFAPWDAARYYAGEGDAADLYARSC